MLSNNNPRCPHLQTNPPRWGERGLLLSCAKGLISTSSVWCGPCGRRDPPNEAVGTRCRHRLSRVSAVLDKLRREYSTGRWVCPEALLLFPRPTSENNAVSRLRKCFSKTKNQDRCGAPQHPYDIATYPYGTLTKSLRHPYAHPA